MEESREASQTVIAAVEDMFFAAKIRATAEHVGVRVRIVKNFDALVKAAREETPLLLIVDLHSKQLDPFTLAEELKKDERLRHVSLLGFFSHVQTDLQRRAEQVGYDRVLPRSVFTKHLAEILCAKY
jgi:PleD family two-component response regulator